LDRGVDTTTGNEAEGVWKTYNDAVTEGTTLSTRWRIEVSMGGTSATGLVDGLLLGEACCMRDDAGAEPFGNEHGVFVGSAAAAAPGANCLQATLSSSPSVILEAEFFTASGDLTIGVNDQVTLALTLSGIPRVAPNCTIAGVASVPVAATRVSNDAGGTTDNTAANSTWHCTRSSLSEIDPDISYLIGLEQAPVDPNNQRAPADVNPCSVGVLTRWVVDFTDAAGYFVKGATSANFNVNQVCFDYDKPDVTLIVQGTTNNDPRFAKAGDKVTLTVFLDRPIDLPTRALLALADCTPTRAGSAGVAFTCPLDVLGTTPEGPVELLVEGMVATNGAKLPTVNFTYTNVWPLVLVDTTDPNLETPNVPVIVDVTPPEVDTLASHSETGPDEKQCSTCCKLVVDIKTNEAIQLPNVTVAGVLVTASDVVGGDEVWQATVELCDATIPAGPIGVCVDMLDLAGNSFSSCDPVGPDEGDDELVDRVYGDVVPLRACLMSNRAGFPGLGKAGDTLSLQLDTSGVVTISSVEIGPARYPADVTVAPYSGHVLDANGRAMRWQADTGVTAAWGDLDPVPWSISFVDPAGARTTLNNITGCFSGDPEKVVVDNTPPFPLLLNVTTDSPWDPVVSNPYEITLCVVASEPIKAPTTVLTGFGPFPDGAVVGGGDTWCMGPRVVLPGDSDFVDQNGCITFSVILTDLAGNAGVASRRWWARTGLLFARRPGLP